MQFFASQIEATDIPHKHFDGNGLHGAPFGARGWRLGGKKRPGPGDEKQFAKLKMAIEIVDLSINNGIFHRKLLVKLIYP